MSSYVLFLIPARAGSRRLPGKNLASVAGIPLVARAIRAARLAAPGIPGGPHRIICSTDSEEIAEVARRWGAEVPFLRPAALSNDEATSAAVAAHALSSLAGDNRNGPRAVVLVQPTSPFVEAADIVRAMDRFDATGHAVAAVTTTHPASWHVQPDGGSGHRLAGSAAEAAVQLLAGSIYVQDPRRLLAEGAWTDAGGLIEPLVVDGTSALDVDWPADLALAQAIATSRPAAPIRIGDRQVGGHAPCFVIAEAGVNHNGDVGLAHRLVDAAADAGADAVKFQTFDADQLAAPGADLAAYQRGAGLEAHDQREMLRELQLDRDAHLALQRHAGDRGLLFFSSPFDEPSVELLDGIGVPAFKIASGELTNLAFLARIASLGRPMLVSTGMADMAEVADAVDAIRVAGAPPVALLHCVSSYPASPDDANLRAIATLRAAFGVPTGWSDHTEGAETTLAAVSLGAALVEKHLTLDRTMRGPDHRSSMEPTAFGDLVAAIRRTGASLGDGVKRPTASEEPVRAVARKSLHWSAALPAGTVVALEHLRSMRPGSGLEPRRAGEVVGRRTTRGVEAGAVVAMDDTVP